MIVEYDRLDFEIKVKSVKDTLLYDIKVPDYPDPDMDTNGGFTIKDCLIPVQYNGYTMSVAGTLTFSNTDDGHIHVDVTVTDDTTMLGELKELLLHT